MFAAQRSGNCFQANELFAAMAADSGVELKELKVDGGATGNSMMQFQVTFSVFSGASSMP